MADPFSAGPLSGTVLTEAIKFVYVQSGEVLSRWRQQHEEDSADVHDAKLRPPEALLEGAVEPVEPGDGAASRFEESLHDARRLLADYADGSIEPRSDDHLVVEQVDALRRLLEAVYGQRITFRGEQRPPSGPLAPGEIDVAKLAGDVAAVRAKVIASAQVSARVRVEEVRQGGEITGVEITGAGIEDWDR